MWAGEISKHGLFQFHSTLQPNMGALYKFSALGKGNDSNYNGPKSPYSLLYRQKQHNMMRNQGMIGRKYLTGVENRSRESGESFTLKHNWSRSGFHPPPAP